MKVATLKLIVATCITESYMTLFLYRVDMTKLFCSLGVGFNSTFYGTFYFVKGQLKTEHNFD